ncbi:MAG: (Fe-S)-binding protein [Candidatus Lokiarchaeota archaeon]|nr:(Fe-S)-binding protein [Candidatus Lokiarchaeota archaeon]
MNIFNEETCQRCGTCLEQCSFLRLPIESAKEEISKMIETRDSRKIIKNCAGCSYCNIVCPTGSSPYELIREIRLRTYREKGVRSLSLITEEMPYNLMSIGLEIDTEEKKRDLIQYENPPKSDKMFYIGCGIPYCFPELTKTKLLEELPILGGMKYCCGGYVHSSFGENEAMIKGLELYEKFKSLKVEKLITFCPGCDIMIKGVYPSIIEGFNIEGQTIIEYLIEKYHKGALHIKNKITQRITFQDPCPWRKLDKKIYEGPREFLEIIGAEVVEMKHNKETSLCCGAPLSISNRSLATKIAKERISEAESINTDIIAHICTGCLAVLSKHATERNIKSYYITELAQMATGEKPSLKILENAEKLQKHVIKTISKNPNIILGQYIIKDGKICRL